MSTLILPADVSWTDGAAARAGRSPRRRAHASMTTPVRAAAQVLRSGEPTVILVGGDATRAAGLAAAVADRRRDRRAGAVRDVPARLERGAGIPAVERLAYFAEAARRNWPVPNI